MAKSHDPGLDIAIFSFCRQCAWVVFSSVSAKKLYDVCLGLVFKVVGSENIRRIRKTLMQVWITGYHGLLREAIWLFVDGSEKP